MNAPTAFPDQQKPVPPYKHTPLFPLGRDVTPYKKITREGVLQASSDDDAKVEQALPQNRVGK